MKGASIVPGISCATIRVPLTTTPGTKWRSKAIVRGESKESTGITRSSGHRRVVEAVGRNERPDPLGGKPRQKLDADTASSIALGAKARSGQESFFWKRRMQKPARWEVTVPRGDGRFHRMGMASRGVEIGSEEPEHSSQAVSAGTTGGPVNPARFIARQDLIPDSRRYGWRFSWPAGVAIRPIGSGAK
ncbi:MULTISPECIES: hypothetical protein [unclassified Methylococcus]|uniref:hypothetical protein n=1 Tax=unclassified Methylococcus TaxID=2618889 RepID=UPI003D7DCD66